MSVAQLGFQIDSSQAANAASDLDKLTSSATRAEQAAQKTGAAGSRMSKGFADLTPALDRIIGSLGKLEATTSSIDSRLEAMTRAAGRATSATQALDKSAIEASSAYKALEANLAAVTAAQNRADAAQAKSLSQLEKQREAVARLNAELQKLRSAPPPAPPASSGKPNSPGASSFGTANVASQLFDIGATAAFMNPLTVGIQQGPQLAQNFIGKSGKQSLLELASGFAAIASPVSLVTIGLTAAAAAAIQFGSSIISASDKAQKALDNHEETIKRIKALYDEGVDTRGSGFGQYTQAQISFLTNRDKFLLNNSMTSQLKSIGGNLGPRTGGGIDADGLASDILAGGQTSDPGYQLALRGMQAQYGAAAGAVMKFAAAAKTGKADVLGFNEEIIKIANQDPANEKLQQIVRNLLELTKGATDSAAALRETGNELEKVSRSYSQWDQQASKNAAKYTADQDYARRVMTRRYDAEVAGIGARTPSQMGSAERRRLEAEPIDPLESPANRGTRIDQRVDLITKQAQFQLDEAKRERGLSLDKILADQQSEIDLIGKTGGAAAALRKEYELTSQLRLDAARTGNKVDEAEIANIKRKAEEYGRLIDMQSQAQLNFDLNQRASDAHLDARSRQIVQTQRQYGLPENVNSNSGMRIGQQYDWQEAKSMAKGFGDSFGNELISGSHNLGKAFLRGLEDTLSSEAQKLWGKFFDSVGNIFADWMTGSKSGSGSNGVVGSVAAALGGKSANDNTAGAFSGLGKLATVTRSALPGIGAAGSALGFVGNYKSGVDSRLTDILNQAALRTPGFKVDAMSGFRPGDPRFHGKGLATDVQLTDLLSGKKLGNYQDASSFREYEKFAQTARQVQMDKYPELADQFRWGGYFGGPKGKYGAADTMHFDLGGAGMAGGSWKGGLNAQQMAYFPGAQSQGMGSAVDAVNKLAGASTEAATNLTSFGGGLGKIGQSLSTSFFPSAPSAPSQSGGGGLFSWLGGLFGGNQNLSQYIGKVGLFANGTSYAPGGLAIVGERGPELVNLPQGSQVTSNHKMADMMRGSGAGQGGNQRPQLNVHVHGANTDAQIREMSRQGAQEVLAQYKSDQVNGDFGDVQKQYTSRVA